jgi:hypothetical protein
VDDITTLDRREPNRQNQAPHWLPGEPSKKGRAPPPLGFRDDASSRSVSTS